MAETTTTTTTVKDETTTTTTTKAPETTTTTTTVADTPNPDGNSADNTNQPSREESLKSAGTASPHAPDAGLKDGTQVLGAEGQSNQDRMDDARREALSNAQDEQKT